MSLPIRPFALTALALLTSAATAQSSLADRLARRPATAIQPTGAAVPVGFQAPDRSQPAYRSVQETFTVTTDADAGPGSLREALALANASPGLDAIAFAIGGGGAYAEIFLQSQLPDLTDPVTIDGDTQGCARSEGLCVRLDGAPLTGEDDVNVGLALLGGGSTVRGLVLTRFFRAAQTSAIAVLSNDNVVAGCYLGTDRTGTVTDPDGVPDSGDELGNGFGLTVGTGDADDLTEGRRNRFGGEAPEDRNVIAGSTASGIQITGANAADNLVLNNHVGTDAAGAAAFGNNSGIVVGFGAARTVVRGNLVSGNRVDGISLGDVDAGVVAENLIGTDAAGTAALPNGTLAQLAEGAGFGVVLRAGTGVVVEDNLISGNLFGGVVIGSLTVGDVASGHTVRANVIGTDATGTQPLPNGVPGVPDVGFGVVFITPVGNVVSGHTVGGDAFEDANVIGFNTTAGIGMEGPGVTGNVVDHNFIGVAPDLAPIPNGVAGVIVRTFPSNNRFGSLDANSEGNVVGFQPVGFGIGQGVVGADVAFNTFVGQPGAYLPIDLGLDGPTADDAGDADAGPNRLQNAPAIEAASVVDDQLTVTYRVDTAPANAAYPLTVRFYARFLFEGALAYAPIGQATYGEADAQQPATATFAFAPDLDGPIEIVATATDAAGNTGEASLAGRPVGAEAPTPLAAAYTLGPVYPNPTAGRARLTLEVAEAQEVTAALYDVLGRRVAVLLDGPVVPGVAVPVEIDGRGLAAGTYAVRVQGAQFVETVRVTLAR